MTLEDKAERWTDRKIRSWSMSLANRKHTVRRLAFWAITVFVVAGLVWVTASYAQDINERQPVVVEAIGSFDPGDETLFTKAGKSDVRALRQATGFTDLSAAERDGAWRAYLELVYAERNQCADLRAAFAEELGKRFWASDTRLADIAIDAIDARCWE